MEAIDFAVNICANETMFIMLFGAQGAEFLGQIFFLACSGSTVCMKDRNERLFFGSNRLNRAFMRNSVDSLLFG